jgi:hypothetical protein
VVGRILRIAVLCAVAVAAACADALPEQDRRITEAAPFEKLSADVLWKDYQADKAAANRRYWGKALDVTGKVTSVEKSAPKRVMFELAEASAVEARLLDDQADAILEAAVVGEKVTLRCFCAGLSGHVVLTSCIKP